MHDRKANIIKGKTTGFCECCNMAFTNIEIHLSSKQHQDFATNDSNYGNIDGAFVIKNGLDLENFWQEIYKKYNIV